VARELTISGEGSDAVMVVILPDTGRNYLSKLYDDEWMRKNALLGSETAREHVAAVLAGSHAAATEPRVILSRTTDLVAAAIETLERHGISQVPVTERHDDAIEGIVGSLNERSLLERAYRDPTVVERTVGEIMDRPLPTIAADASLDDAFTALSEGAQALVAVDGGKPVGIVTKLDLLEFLAHHASKPRP